MTGLERFAVYQLKDTTEMKEFRFRSYQFIKEKGIRPWCGNYEKVYVGIMLPEDTPGKIRERFNRKLPKNFKGHSISVSDVLVLHTEENATEYYVETTDFIAIEGFFSKKSSRSKLAYGDRHVQIEGKSGTWFAFDTLVIEEKIFFLMEHEQYQRRAAWIVVDEQGKVVVDDVRNGFDPTVRQQMEDYVKQSQSRNEERVRNNSSTEDQNQCKNVQSKNVQNKKAQSKKQDGAVKKAQGRPSVLAKLHQKQKRIAANRKNSDLTKD